ncbi:MAG: ATP-binding protein [Chitinophagaceae bacterium]|nr:ATP-binding protein [Chitinophagaceae bacterium]
MVNLVKNTAKHLQADLQWLAEVVRKRYEAHHTGRKLDVQKMHAPALGKEDSVYKRLITEFRFSNAERIVLLLSLVPHTVPYLLDDVMTGLQKTEGRDRLSFNRTGTVPTLDLVLFILAGDDLELRLHYQQLFDPENFLCRNNIITPDADAETVSVLQQPIRLSKEYLSLLLTGKPYHPDFSLNFPAKRITTQLSLDDLVLGKDTLDNVNEINAWVKYGATMLQEWDLARRLSPGLKVLFFGPPGTGKTTTASVIGKMAGLDVYRIDLSMVISKYVGETQKNLAKVFDAASHKNWILFFDEADALFAKRSDNQADQNVHYANQDVAYLLQKLEDHSGVVILSSNMRKNMDEAFTRRFHNIIFFPMPSAGERQKIWEIGFSKKTKLDKDVDLERLAENYIISGGAIMNVVRYSSLKAMERKKNIILLKDILSGVRREYFKEGRTI